jgi:hypothetical protein
MANEKLFENFNAVKQQIAGIVDLDNTKSIEVSKQEALKTVDPSLSASSSIEPIEANNNNSDEFDIDSEDGQEESELDISQESINIQKRFLESEYDINSSIEIYKICDQLDLGFEQINIIRNCFDTEGDLSISEESFNIVKNQYWITGHQLNFGSNLPSSSMEIYYASESLKDTLVSIMEWIIEKIKSLIEWIFNTANVLNETFSYDSMIERFKTGIQGPDSRVTVEELLPEYNRLLALSKELDQHASLMHAKFSNMYRQAALKPETKAIADRAYIHLQNLLKASKKYKDTELDIGLGSTIDLNQFSGILNSSEIKDYSDLFKVLADAGQQAMNLKQIGLIYLTQFEDLHSFMPIATSTMLYNHTKDFDKYMDDNTKLFTNITNRLRSDAQDVYKSCTNGVKEITKEDKSQTFGSVSLNITDYKIRFYGQIFLEIKDVYYSKSDFLRIEDVVSTSVKENIVNDFKSSIGNYYSVYMNTMSAHNSFKCYVANRNAQTKSFTAYSDPASAAMFYSAYTKAIMFMASGHFDDTIKSVFRDTKSIASDAQKAKVTSKQMQDKVLAFAKTNINALEVFSSKQEGTYISLQEHTKKLIGQSYMQLYNYTNVRPLINALMCYKNAKYILERNADLYAALQKPAFKLQSIFKFFMKLNKVVISNAYELKKAAQELNDAGVDASFYMDTAHKQILLWTDIFKTTIDYKRKTF